MAKIEINKAFTMDLDEVRAGMEKMAESLKSEHGMQYQWDTDDSISFKHKAGKGSLRIVGNELQLSLKMSMLYAAMAPVVRSRINEWADEYIS